MSVCCLYPIYNAFTLYISVFSYLLFAILAILSLLERKIEWGNSARPGRYLCMASVSSDPLRLELWQGVIPAIVRLHPSDLTALEAPKPYYVMIPRLAYLGTVAGELLEHFKDSAPHSNSNEVWFDHQSVPLNWQLPAGVLFDLHGGDSTAYPWEITIHFLSFPSATLLRSEGDKALEFHFFHSLKQGMYLEHGSSATAMSMQADEQQRLWLAMCADDAASFAATDKRLRRTRPSAVPVRLVVDGAPVAQPFLRMESPADEGGSITVGDVLRKHLSLPTGAFGVRAVCHGVDVPANAPLAEVWAALAHPDHFLYVTVLPAASR